MNSQHYHLSSTGADGMSPFGLQPMAGQPLVATTGAPFGAGSQSMTTDQQANTSFMNASSSSNTNKSHNGMGGGGGSMGGGGGGGMGGASDLLTAHRERGRMLQVLQQQQQQQQQQRQLTMSRGLPVLQTMAGHDIRTPGAGTSAQRFMVEDFASAGALLSRPEQEFLLRGYPNMGAPGMAAFPQADAMDLSHPSKLADFLFAKQAAALNGAQMLPRVTRLPCQARGMKADHNSTTAFFEILEDARHGQHLLCSHPACRSSGVKFRYCLYCKKPVTKQNFRSRHLHADLDPNHNGKMGKLVRKRSNEGNGKDDGSAASDEPSSKQSKVNTTKEVTSVSSSKSRQALWEALLTQRPEDLDDMSMWMGRVLTTSDPSAPLRSEENKEENEEDTESRKGRWNILLSKRPLHHVSMEDANEWLVKVLQVSAEKDDEKKEGNEDDSNDGDDKEAGEEKEAQKEDAED